MDDGRGKVIAMKPIITIVLAFIILVCMSACQPVFPHNLPDREIIYQESYYGIGFVNADGQGNQVLELKQQFAKPVWSSDGRYLYGLSNGKGLSGGYPAVWDLHKQRFKVCDWNHPHFVQIQGLDDPEDPYAVIVNHRNAIILFDIPTCKEKQFWVNYEHQVIHAVNGFSYSRARQELVYGLVVGSYRDRQYRLMLKNLTTGEETQLAEGINPIWSPDSNQIAFVGLDGLYVISLTDHAAETIQLTDEPLFDPWVFSSPAFLPTWPTWSPDGLWLAYHPRVSEENSERDKFFIYTINIHERRPEAILEGGYYPSWRP
jgi:hypothetical protein